MGEEQLGLVKFLGGLVNFPLVFFKDRGSRIAEHSIEDLDAILGLLRKDPAVDLLDDVFKQVSFFQHLHELF